MGTWAYGPPEGTASVLTRISRRFSLAAACLTTVGVLAAAGPADAVSATPATVTVTTTKLKSIPASYFIGLSFESSNTQKSSIFATTGTYPALLKNLGHGVMRFGGKSVDTSTYTGITRSNLASLAKLVQATGWKVNYSENLGHFKASRVTSDAKAVATALGSHLMAFACGNEPDDYLLHHLRPAGYTEAAYLKEVPPCFAAIHKGAPGAPVEGPNTFHVAWLPSYAAAVKAGTFHINDLAEQYYPMTTCGRTTPGGAATLLSRATAAAEASVFASVASSAAVTRTPFIIGETNSASCSGITGVSNTFAAALWAVDYVLLAAEKGARGIYFHGSLSTYCTSYTPICNKGKGRYVAEPVYYGLLFAHLLGSGQMLKTTIATKADIAAHAVTSGGRTSVMVENLSGSPSALTLKDAKVSGTATVLHLTGRALGATSGVKIQGRSVTSSGTFAPGAASHATCKAGVCTLTIPGHTAVILRLPA
jgi:hypothetical protein